MDAAKGMDKSYILIAPGARLDTLDRSNCSGPRAKPKPDASNEPYSGSPNDVDIVCEAAERIVRDRADKEHGALRLVIVIEEWVNMKLATEMLGPNEASSRAMYQALMGQ